MEKKQAAIGCSHNADKYSNACQVDAFTPLWLFPHTASPAVGARRQSKPYTAVGFPPRPSCVHTAERGAVFMSVRRNLPVVLGFFFFSCVPQGNSQRVLLFSEMQILSSLSRWPWGFPTAAHRFKRERYCGVRWCRLRGRAHT